MRDSIHRPRRQRVSPPDPPRRRGDAEPSVESREPERPAATVKDINVVRGDDRPQAVRHVR